jgi:hypothetical protein
MLRFLPLVIALAIATAYAPKALARPCHDIELSEAVLVEGTALRLNGLAIRRVSALRVKVVLAGLYLERPTRDAAEAIASPQMKRLDLHVLRRVSRGDVSRALRRGVRVNAPALLPRVEDELATLAFVLPDARSGTLITFVGLPSGESRLYIDGERTVTFEDPALMPAILSVFLGPEPGNDAIRGALLGAVPCS